jgi:hypothetical protein
MIKAISLTTFFSFIFVFSCSDNVEDLLARRVKTALRDDQGISRSEFEGLQDFVKSNPDLASFSDKKALVDFIQGIADELCQAKRKPIACTPSIDSGEEASGPKKPTVFHVFYENSLSMDGYLNGKTAFIDASLDLMTQMNMKEEKVQLYYINQQSHPVDSVITDFVDFLKPQNVSKYGKQGRGNSKINDVLRIVADTVCAGDGRIGMVISDYIYSINGKKVQDELDLQKHTTTLSLKCLARKDYALLVIKINSQFNGLYYPMQGSGVQVNEERPVYMWLMGPKDKILAMPSEYRLSEKRGYDMHMIILNEDKSDPPYYTILDRTQKLGSFDKEDRGATKSYAAIKDIEANRDGTFQFSVAVDLSNCPADGAYLLDPTNYVLKSDLGDEFDVTGISPIEEVEHNDKDQKGTATHFVTIATKEKLSKGRQRLVLSLKKAIPSWVGESSTESDMDAAGRKGKTFGLSYLIQGAATAFDYTPKSVYYSFPININN